MGVGITAGRTLRAALLMVLAACVVAALGLTVVVLRNQDNLERRFRYDATWDGTQALADSLRLQLALAKLAMPDGGGDPERVRSLFEVTVSALRTLNSGDNRALNSSRPEFVDIISAFAETLARAGALLPDLEQPGTARRIIDLLQPMNPRLSALASYTYAAEADAVSAAQRQIGIDQWYHSALLMVLVVYCIGLVVLLMLRNRMLTRAHSDARALADNLLTTGAQLASANTAVEAANADLSLSNRRFHVALENMSQGLCMVDGERRLIVCNRRFVEMFALRPELSLPGTPLDQLIETGEPAPENAALRAAARALQAEHLAIARQDRPVAFMNERAGRVLSISQQPLPDGGWLATYEDVTERRRADARIEHMALHDALTGLPNRVAFRQRIDEIVDHHCASAAQLSVLLLDLDHFKEVNDTLGHGAGDGLLQAVSRRLANCTRDSELVARLGGDEFAVIQTPGSTTEDAAALATRIVESIGAPYEIDGERVVVGASVGVAVHPASGASAELLLKFADMALYQAKANGRGTYCFYVPEMDLQVQTRRALSADLRDAIGLGQFEVLYQPLMDLWQHRVGGFEALLRWRHPERGMVPPAQFIPLAEEIGFISVIGDWVLRQACADAAGWPAYIKLAVNLSPRQFHDGDVIQSVQRALLLTGLSPSRLELEITESLLLQDGDEVLAALRELRGIGVGVALDDFGTGYSSLSYLRKFPFTKLKIDQSFVRGMETREDNIIIVQAVAAMAQRLGMTVTAEGIETEEQLAIVRKAGCSHGQGFLFGQPARASETARFIAMSSGVGADVLVG
jgi:diguanylate cyclase (GGDEF)-like protein